MRDMQRKRMRPTWLPHCQECSKKMEEWRSKKSTTCASLNNFSKNTCKGPNVNLKSDKVVATNKTDSNSKCKCNRCKCNRCRWHNSSNSWAKMEHRNSWWCKMVGTGSKSKIRQLSVNTLNLKMSGSLGMTAKRRRRKVLKKRGKMLASRKVSLRIFSDAAHPKKRRQKQLQAQKSPSKPKELPLSKRKRRRKRNVKKINDKSMVWKNRKKSLSNEILYND